MAPVPPSRLALVLSLVVLGSSLGVFSSVSGIAPDETHEFAIENNALIATTGDGQQHELVKDVRTLARIEIIHDDDHYVIRTVDREPPAVDTRTRVRAQQAVMSIETVGDDVPATDSAAYVVRRIPTHLSSDRAAVHGATPNASLWTALEPNAAPTFTVRQRDDTVVFDRRKPQWSVDRVLVVVTPADSRTKYSVVVNLRTETVDSLVRLDRGSR